MTDRLFSIDEVPEVPLLRVPARKGAAVGAISDARFKNDYPPSWDKCETCGGTGRVPIDGEHPVAMKSDLSAYFTDADGRPLCGDCLGMGSLKAMVRLQAGHRCVRCHHPYMPEGDAAMLGIEPSGMHDCETCGATGVVNEGVAVVSEFGDFPQPTRCPTCKGRKRIWTPWSACDERCVHAGSLRWRYPDDNEWIESSGFQETAGVLVRYGPDFQDALPPPIFVEAEWRILTVHHLDGDKANCRWWNLASLCQRCHLEIQAKVVMERLYPFEHSEWFKPFAAGYYAWVYNDEDLTRDEVTVRMDELLALERLA